MPDIDANIRVQAVGAETAASALEGASGALNKITSSSKGLEEQFQHKFQHIGLQLFAGEALRASGVGAETRQVIGTLNLAITSMGAAMGAAAPYVLLVVAALVAVAGIAVKVAEHHKNQADNLDKLISAEEKERDSLNQSMESLQKYVDEQGPHAESVLKVLQAKQMLQAFEEAVEQVNLRKQIAALQEMIQTENEHYKVIKAAEEAQRSLSNTKILAIAIDQGATAGVAAIIAKYTDFKKQLDTVADSLLKHNVALQQAKLNAELLANGEHEVADKIGKAWDDATKAQEKDDDEKNKAILKGLNEQAHASYDAFAAEQAAHEKFMGKIEAQAGETFKKISNEQSVAFAKMVVEGESFSQATAHLWRDIAEQVIAQIERMIVEYEIWMAVTGGTGVASGGFGSFVGKAFGMAEGGSFMVDKPTLFLAGEAGQPEMATFTPLSKMNDTTGGGSGGGTVINIGTIQSNAYGVSNPDSLAEQVGRKIVERIKGRGEIDFTRTT